ncbi:MAG: S-layer homology domain-containing protein [Actinomyces sp.]|nr:MAG: S-layer homology domain-containing protein [Actinomyces sp.]
MTRQTESFRPRPASPASPRPSLPSAGGPSRGRRPHRPGRRRTLALGVIVGALVAGGVAAASTSFDDVPAGKFYEAPVEWAVAQGITTGSPAGSRTFKPEDPVTRGESVTFLKRYDDAIVQPAIAQTLGGLGCTGGQMAYVKSGAWTCGTPVPEFTPRAGTARTLATTFPRAAALAIGSDGFPVVAYAHGDFTTPSQAGIRVYHCTALDCSTGADVGPVYTSFGATHPDIAIGTDGFPVISFYDESSGKRDLRVVHCTSRDCSTRDPVRNLTNTGGSTLGVGDRSAITIGDDGFPVISYVSYTDSSLRLHHCTKADCSTGSNRTLVASGVASDPTGIAIGGDGFPVIVYRASSGGGFGIYRCTKTDCSTGSDGRGDTRSGVKGAHPSITIGTDGLPVVAYEAFDRQVTVFRCTSASCANGQAHNLATVAASHLVAGTSVAVGADDLPVVVYTDFGGGNNNPVRLVTCSTTSCSSSSSIDLAAISTDDGPSVAIGSDANPVVATVVDNTRGDLNFTPLIREMTGVVFQ